MLATVARLCYGFTPLTDDLAEIQTVGSPTESSHPSSTKREKKMKKKLLSNWPDEIQGRYDEGYLLDIPKVQSKFRCKICDWVPYFKSEIPAWKQLASHKAYKH
jgi:hypothetical protein